MTPSAAPAARGRPRSFDYDSVLQQALEVFWRHGYQSTTTRDLEAALGLSQSSIYNTFGSKDGLLAAALDRYEALVERDVLGPLEASDRGLAAIDDFLVALGHWVTHGGRRGCMLVNMMAEDGGMTVAIRDRTRGYRRRVRDAVARALGRAAAAGETDHADVEVHADLLIGLILGLNIAARGGASAEEQTRLLASARHEVGTWATG